MIEARTLSGGLGTELERCGYNAESDPLFGSSLLMHNPEAIVSAHKRFLESGAEVITTATYQANVDTLQTYLGLTFEESRKLLQESVRVARKAVSAQVTMTKTSDNDYIRQRLLTVAGSVGPYGAGLRNGSEYHGTYDAYVTEEFLKSWHRPRIEALVDVGIDLLAFETIPTMHEGIALVRLLKEFPSTKAWLSFSCKDGERTCHGHSFAEAVRTCLQLDSGQQLIAVGVNCTNPVHVSSLLAKASRSSSSTSHAAVPFIVYPNSGENWNHDSKWSGTVEGCPTIASHVSEWISQGARYVGGCCRVTPTDISEIAREVRKNGTVGQ